MVRASVFLSGNLPTNVEGPSHEFYSFSTKIWYYPFSQTQYITLSNRTVSVRPGTKSEGSLWKGGESPKQLGLCHVFTSDAQQSEIEKVRHLHICHVCSLR